MISLDATGTLLYPKAPIAETYCLCAAKAGAQPPPIEAMRRSFKAAMKASLERWPCFGHAEGLSGREWWRRAVRQAFDGAGAKYSEKEHARVFRRVYQYFGRPSAYEVFDDVQTFLDWASVRYCLGLVSNNVDRLSDGLLPMYGLDEDLRFFVLSQELGFEKPSREIFAKALEEASAALGYPVRPEEVLHVGDNYQLDYCGARAAGMAAALISRKGVLQNQTWIEGPDYEGKAEEAVQEVFSLAEIRQKLEAAGSITSL